MNKSLTVICLIITCHLIGASQKVSDTKKRITNLLNDYNKRYASVMNQQAITFDEVEKRIDKLIEIRLMAEQGTGLDLSHYNPLATKPEDFIADIPHEKLLNLYKTSDD